MKKSCISLLFAVMILVLTAPLYSYDSSLDDLLRLLTPKGTPTDRYSEKPELDLRLDAGMFNPLLGLQFDI